MDSVLPIYSPPPKPIAFGSPSIARRVSLVKPSLKYIQPSGDLENSRRNSPSVTFGTLSMGAKRIKVASNVPIVNPYSV